MTSAADRAATGSRGAVVATIAAGTILNPLDATMMAVALVDVRRDFAVSLAVASWAVSAFFVAGAAGQALMGRLADRLGPRRTFRGGMLAVGLCCVLAPLSPSIGWLIGVRVVQAVGSSVAFPAGMAVIRNLYTLPDGTPPTRVMGVLTTVNTLAAAVGPFLGGLLVQLGGWQATFWFNVPVALAGCFLAGRVLPRDQMAGSRSANGLDLPGAALYCLILVSLLGFLLSPGSVVGLTAVAGLPVAVTLFVVQERRSRSPFFDLRLLGQHPVLAGVFVRYALANTAYYGLLLAVPTWLQDTRGATSTTAGLLLVPMAACSAMATPFAARWIQRAGPYRPLLAASLTLLVGGSLLLLVDSTTPLVAVAAIAIPVGVFNNPNTLGLQAVMYRRVDAALTATASGVFQSFRYIGSTLATALLATSASPHGDSSMTVTAVVIVGLALVLITMSLGRPSRAPRRPPHPLETPAAPPTTTSK